MVKKIFQHQDPNLLVPQIIIHFAALPSLQFSWFHTIGPQISFIDLLRFGVTVGRASFKRSQVGATLLT